MEPTPADVAAVSAAMGGGQPAPAPTPTPAPQPTPTPAPQPTPQPAPANPTVPTDPFATLFAQPSEPTAPSTPSQPTEPTPTPQPTEMPVEPSQPANPAPAQPPAEEAPVYQTYDEYLESLFTGIPDVPEMPDAEKIAPDDPAAIKQFFDDLVSTAVERATVANSRREALQTSERRLWDAAFEQYGTLRTNKQLRDMVHAVRMAEFNKGVALTPLQAADRVLEALRTHYQRGVADNTVHTTIEAVQPTGGNGTTVPTTLERENVLTAVQDGGEVALANFLDTQIKAGKL